MNSSSLARSPSASARGFLLRLRGSTSILKDLVVAASWIGVEHRQCGDLSSAVVWLSAWMHVCGRFQLVLISGQEDRW